MNVLTILTAITLFAILPSNAFANQQIEMNQKFEGSHYPPSGISLFDKLFSRVEGGKRVYDLPYPIEELQKAANGKAYGAHYPFGRSIQKPVIDPATNTSKWNPFIYPRTVFTFKEAYNPNLTPPIDAVEGRLFVGFHGKKGQLEVISHNEIEGRAEYQVVHNYFDGSVPEVKYANRNLCLSCHTNKGTIFSKDDWKDSNLNRQNSFLMKRAREVKYGIPKSNNLLNGIEIEPTTVGRGLGRTTPSEVLLTGGGVEFIDEKNKQFNEILRSDFVLKRACKTEVCAKNLLKVLFIKALTNSFLDIRKSHLGSLQQEVERNIHQQIGTHIISEESVIGNRNPFDVITENEFNTLKDNPFEGTVIDKIITENNDGNFSAEQNPKTPRRRTYPVRSFSEIVALTSHSLTHIKLTKYDWIKIFDEIKRSRQAVHFFWNKSTSPEKVEVVRGSFVEDWRRSLVSNSPIKLSLTRRMITPTSPQIAFDGTRFILPPKSLIRSKPFTVTSFKSNKYKFDCFHIDEQEQLIFCSTLEFGRLYKAIDQVSMPTNMMFSRVNFLNQLWSGLNSKYTRLYPKQDFKPYDLFQESQPGTVTNGGPSSLRFIKKFCIDCHQAPQDYPPGFVYDSDNETVDHLKDLKPALIKRLESNNDSFYMPPAGTDGRQYLMENPHELDSLTDYIRGL